MLKPRGSSSDRQPLDRQRVDKWLWHARVVRTRAGAAALTASGHVRINGQRRTLRVYHVGRFVVWGVTARILQNLLERLGIASGFGEVEE